MTRVLMLGPEMDAKGGIASVLQMYRQFGLFDQDVAFMPTTRDGSILQKLGFYQRFLEKFAWKLLFDPIKIVHIHTAVKGSFARKAFALCLAKMLGRKTIVHFHGAQFIVFYKKSPFFMKWLIKDMFRNADKILCLNKTCQHNIWKLTGAHAQVLYNPTVLHEPVEPQAKADGTVNFLFMGRLGKRKGVYDLIEAARYITAPNVKIHLYGDGEIEQVRKKIEEAGVSERVQLQGWISGGEKENVFRAAQVLLLPSYNEGLPMSVLEALSYGMPVISTPVGGTPDAVKDGVNGYLIEPGNAKALAEKIDALAQSETLRRSMGEAGYAMAHELFDIRKIINELHTIYQEMDPQAKLIPAAEPVPVKNRLSPHRQA